VIIDLERFIEAERPHWRELEAALKRLESEGTARPGLRELLRLHALYQRASAGLARVATFSSEPEVRLYLESLVSRAYGEIHETRVRPHRLAPWSFLVVTFPRAFRRHARAFALAVLITCAGCVFGGSAVVLDAEAKDALMPFAGLHESPNDRVRREESTLSDRLRGSKSTFSAMLMTHNIRVSIACLALGMTWGIGTSILLFYNGVTLGAVAFDYAEAGQVKFLLGWLLPHGAVEIPAILIAGQAGLVLASALIGWGDRTSLKSRLRTILPDVGALVGGVAALMAWAGFIEAFLSQYHEPVLPYALKIGFGLLEGSFLALFLAKSGSRTT
jgi:uncharacterized membrane protein SpoIIM required for sporulation